jgi:hypothetical protein
MNGVKILTQDNAGFVRFHRDNIHNLEKTFIPHSLGFATEQREVNLVMDIANTIRVGMFLRLGLDFLVVFEPTGRIRFDEPQELGVFTRPWRSIKHEVAEFVDGRRHLQHQTR